MKHIAIVMAAGSGKRMGTDKPKQYLEVNGRPILYYSLKTLEDSFIDEIILVTRREDISYCKEEIVDLYGFKKVTQIVPGGSERFESVFEGIKAVEDKSSYVYVHDGARPMLSKETLDNAKNDVERYRATVVAVPSKDTVKISDKDGNIVSSPDRSLVWNAQTPQCFEYELIYSSFIKMMDEISKGKKVNITDDGQVCELYSDVSVHLTMGDYSNIKVTTPEDVSFVEKFLSNL